MVDLPAALGVHLTRDDVEAGASEGVAASAQPRVRARDEPRLLALVDGPERASEGVTAPSLHLDEYHEPTSADHEVDLDAARANVALEDPVATLFEVRGGAILTLVT